MAMRHVWQEKIDPMSLSIYGGLPRGKVNLGRPGSWRKSFLTIIFTRLVYTIYTKEEHKIGGLRACWSRCPTRTHG